MFDVVGLGTVVVDHQVVLQHYPVVDTKNEILQDHRQVGGPVPTALVLLARFGKQCAFIGNWSDDTYGQMIQTDLEREKIDIQHSVCRPGSRTGFAHVWIDHSTGSRTIACARPDNPISFDEINKQVLSHCRALHLDGWPSEAARKAAEIVKQNGGYVFLDTGSLKPGMEELIPLVDVLNCPERFLIERFRTDDVAVGGTTLLEMGPRIVTITRGDRGAVLLTSDETYEVDAFPVKAVDSTGAGDIFCGSLVYAILEDWPLERALKFSAATAALKCIKLGNRNSLPLFEEVVQLIGE